MGKFQNFNVLLLIIGVAYIVSLMIPGFDPQCVIKSQTGLSCPGCGSTHSMMYLLQGDLITALRHNLLLLPVIIIGIIGAYNYWKNGEFLSTSMQSKAFAWIVFIVVLVYTVLRNIPSEAFDFLRP